MVFTKLQHNFVKNGKLIKKLEKKNKKIKLAFDTISYPKYIRKKAFAAVRQQRNSKMTGDG